MRYSNKRSNFCLFARSYSGSRKGSGKTQQSGRNRDEPDTNRIDALFGWSVVSCLVVPSHRFTISIAQSG
jgi:hypothetical protein